MQKFYGGNKQGRRDERATLVAQWGGCRRGYAKAKSVPKLTIQATLIVTVLVFMNFN